MDRAVVIAIAIIIAGALIGGRYASVPVPRGDAIGFVLIHDRFTGSVVACTPGVCRPVPFQPTPFSN